MKAVHMKVCSHKLLFYLCFKFNFKKLFLKMVAKELLPLLQRNIWAFFKIYVDYLS